MRALPFLLLPLAAEAQIAAGPLAETHFARNFCWERSLDERTLAADPAQPIRRIALGREPLGQSRRLGVTLMEVSAVLRDGSGDAEALAACQPGETGLDCRLRDGSGGFGLEAQGDELVLTIGPVGLSLPGRRGEVRIEPAEGEVGTFRLRRCG
ncbi:hypothetical protein [Rubellimicrobium roseum]|uniref:Uncharacterized protein n=1 Tax=Rubellimicrobium roseum TaxID=687525 RepID=A0A5C4NBM0_9RHOB|nr:hypothetical protein [Rubellimicrobium roseum]TNC71432.1 hypothetical protein FHG71_11805 [Rubellimicrobium roseum]